MTAPVVNTNALVTGFADALTALGIPFGDSNRPTNVVQNKPYVVGFFDGGRVGDRTMLSRDGLQVTAAIHTYAWTPDSVRVGRRRMIEALYGLARTVKGGWLVHSPVHVEVLPIEREDKLSPPLFWQTDVFLIRLTPA